jgi:hypothetical protein
MQIMVDAEMIKTIQKYTVYRIKSKTWDAKRVSGLEQMRDYIKAFELEKGQCLLPYVVADVFPKLYDQVRTDKVSASWAKSAKPATNTRLVEGLLGA